MLCGRRVARGVFGSSAGYVYDEKELIGAALGSGSGWLVDDLEVARRTL